MNWLASHPLARDLGWTLVHFLWQGALIAGLLALALLFLRRGTAQTRYAVSVAALALCVIAPVLTLTALVKSRPAPITERMLQPAEKALWGEPESVVRVAAAPVLAVPVEQRGLIELWRMRVEHWLPGFIALWLGGIVLLSARLAVGWLRLRRLAGNVAPATPEWLRAFEQLCHRMGMSAGTVRLFSSARVGTPAVLGWLKPVVLLPLARMNGLTPEQIEAILAHELAHVRRNDYLVNILQSLIEVVLFYHPAVWWISAKIREERENCCDDLAVALCGNRLTYARALTVLEEARNVDGQLALGAAGGSLLRRIRRLLVPNQTPTQAPLWTGVAAIAIAMLAAFTALAATVRDTQAQPGDGAPGIEQLAPAMPRFQIRRVAESASPATERMALPSHILEQGRREESLHVEKEVFLDETAVTAASVLQDPLFSGRWQVEVRFAETGAIAFAELTAGNIGRQLAIVVDGNLVAAPVIRSAIPMGRAIIDGAFSRAEAEAVASALSSESRAGSDRRSAGSRPVPVFTRTFRVERQTFLEAITSGKEALPAQGYSAQEQLREYFLRAADVAFPAFAWAEPPDVIHSQTDHPIQSRKAIFFNDRTGVLFVRAEIEELDRIERAIYKVVPPPTQVLIEARFVELAGVESKPLELDWLIGSITPPEGQETGSASPAGLFPGNGTAPRIPRIETPLPSAGLAGILTAAQLRVVMRALEQRQGANILGAPRVTTLSGRQARLVTASGKTVFGDVPVEIQRAGFQFWAEDANSNLLSTIQVGHLIDVIPTFQQDGQQIELKVKAAMNEFLGENGKSPIPLFRLRQREATATIPDGQTLVLGGFDDWTNSKEKLPDRQLLLFVTATLIDPAGNVLRRSNGFRMGATRTEVLRQLREQEAGIEESGDLIVAEWLPEGHTRRMRARLVFREDRLMSVEYEQQ